MPQINTETRPVDPDVLQKFCEGVLTRFGMPQNEASIMADCLVQADLSGIASHGVARLPHYVSRLQKGSIEPNPDMIFEAVSPASGRLDGGHGFGHVVMHRATQHVMDLAQESGAGWVAVCNSSHCGALGNFGRQLANAGMIGFVFTHVGSLVLPHGATQPFCGTNPICITAPGPDDQHLCLDMATSVTPWNSIMNAIAANTAIPAGWGVNDQGRDITDPQQVRALYPIAEYKGAGLGLMIDVLCALLVGAPAGPDIPLMYGDLTKHRRLGGLVGAIDVKRFIPLHEFHERVASLTRQWNALSVPGHEPVMVPGEPERRNRQNHTKNGLPLARVTIDQLNDCARALGCSSLGCMTDTD